MPSQKDPQHIDISSVALRLRQFAASRDWEQYHNPKNLAMALAGEAASCLRSSNGATPEESTRIGDTRTERDRVAQELADILIHAIRRTK